MTQVQNPTITSLTQNQQVQLFQKSLMWYATTVILILMIIATVLGNTLVLITTWLNKHLHQPNKYFIACLAVADLLVGTFSVPIRLYLHLSHTELVAVQLCHFWSWIDISCEVASIVTLTVISIDRYLKISNPFKYRSQMTTSRSIIVIFFTWLISSVFATLGQFPLGGSPGVAAIAGRGCTNDNPIYLTVTAAVFFFFPALVIIIMYTIIFYIAHKRHKMTRNGTLGQSRKSSENKSGKNYYQELKTIRVLLLVVGTFIICWGPFFILFLLREYKPTYLSLSKKDAQIVGSVLAVILPSFNSLCNPVIYACFDREYNKAFKYLFQKLCCRISSGEEENLNRSLMNSTRTQSFRLKKRESREVTTPLHIDNKVQENCPAENTLLCNVVIK